VIFVANGAGDSRSVTRNLIQAVAETSTPLQIETCVWSFGPGRVVADQVDQENHLLHGRKLAGDVLAYRHAFPGRRVCLMGQSAGCAVVLRAAEHLPPGSVDRIVLLAPSVCATYDLRPALRVACEGIDVFHSERDRWVLGLGVRIVGTAEGDCRVAAGRYGFTPLVNGPADAGLYCRLRQYPWDPMVQWSGNTGGHFGNHETEFLRAYVLPLLTGHGNGVTTASASIQAGY
jgi:pimeloyl-ACP methyl ester carboxylesterase